MDSSTLCSLILTLCLILISHSAFSANTNLINQICQETSKDQSNCTKILTADPKVVQAQNFFEFSKAVLELALNNGMKGQNFLKGLAQKTRTPAIAECANSDYDGVVGSFRSALAELKDDHLAANYEAKVAGDGSTNCETALAKAHIIDHAISNLNYQTSLLSNIAFLATSKLSRQFVGST